jgi:GMC oxidoreductase/NAD(P)-binding Rossmann-like domain
VSTASASSPTFDAIVVGSGPGGATVARELSRRGKRVLILERGGNAPLKESMRAIASVLNGVTVSDNLKMGRAFTTGGTTSVYLAVADPPPLKTYQSLGIDLSRELDEANRELPLAELPDHLVRPQSLRLRESAESLGYDWPRSPMLVDQSKCANGYCYDARWTARSFVQDAIAGGATLINRARVVKVLVEDGRAVGVEYQVRLTRKAVETRQAYGARIILAAGGAASPILLRRSGIKNVASKGFYCHPNFMVYGTISGLKAGDGFGGTMGTVVDGDIHVGDGNFARTLHRMLMLGNGHWMRALMHTRSIGIGVMVTEGVGGGLREDEKYHKALTDRDRQKLAQGETIARRLIVHAGGRNLVKTALSAAHLGGVIRIGEHLDNKLETEFRNLHVCDGAVIPENGYGVQTPTLTLICLGKYLARHLSSH